MRGARDVVVAGVMALVVTLGPGGARADILQDLGATFEQVAQDLQAAFPKVEARIVAVHGAEVRLEGARVSALRPGLELVAFREGALFRHPITNQPLGRAEEQVAILSVTAVEGEQALARIVVTEGGRAPVVGDGARMTAGRISVAVLPPLGIAVPGETAEEAALLLVSRFSALLEKTGRFLAVDPQRVLEVAAPAPARGSPPSALGVARRLGAPAVLSSRVVVEDGTRYLETAWISGRTGVTLAAMRTRVVRAAYPPRFAWEQTPELARRFPFGRPIRGLALADLDGDGRGELIVGDEEVVTVYRWQGTGPVAVAGGEFRPGGTILSVDAADVNGTDRAQVVVVAVRLGTVTTVRSSVLELADEGLRPLYEANDRYLRVVSVGSESWLLEQPLGETEPFAPTIRRLVWHDRRYRDGVTLTVPKGVSVYGLALMRLTGSPEPEIVAITPEDRLAVWTGRGKRLWTSADGYGGATVTFEFAPSHAVRDQIRDQSLVGRVLGRVIALPAGPDGPEVLVFENLVPGQGRAGDVSGKLLALLPRLASPSFTRGRIHRLRWQDGGFVRVWQSRPTEGYIADFAHGDVDGDRLADVVVGVVPRGLSLDTLSPTGRPKGHLVFYELP